MTMKKSENMKHWARINNRAHRTEEPPEDLYCGCCSNHLLFAMRDEHHEFTLGITTILECLLAAVDQGAVPPLPDEWWREVVNHYKLTSPRFQEGKALSGAL